MIKKRSEDFELNLPHNKSLVIWDRFGQHEPPRPQDEILKGFVEDCVRETGTGPVIIFDSWSSLMKPGEGGESTGQTAPTYICLRKLADLGATIVVVDHSRKYKRKIIYGGVDKKAKTDTIHLLEVIKDKQSPENTIVTVTSTLKRYAPEGYGGFSFKLVSEKDASGWHVKGLERVSDPKTESQRHKWRNCWK